jgi:nucleotide-binding universal stress UspA family protein
VTPGGDHDTFELGTDGPTSILVGVDGSTTAARAGWYAAGLARRQGARVVAVYVEPGPGISGAAPGGASLVVAQQQAFDEVAADFRQRVGEVSRELGVDFTFIAAHGDPFRELCRIADEMHADAVVVGASTKAGHRLVGSLAVRLVRANKWPVTVVP